jgi:hypothetical protein
VNNSKWDDELKVQSLEISFLKLMKSKIASELEVLEPALNHVATK